MIDNTDLVYDLINQDVIRLKKGSILDAAPRSLGPHFSFDKIEGMLLGAAIGDSLGATSEGLTGKERLSKFGEIRDYVSGQRSDNKRIGMPTDDTQLTFWTLKQLIIDGGLIPDNLAKRFCRHHIIGIGSTVRAFIQNYMNAHKPWYSSGTDSLGNGALMRISPVVVPYLLEPRKSMYADAALDTMITHNAYANNATCVAFVHILWELLSMNTPPMPSWWIDTYVQIVRDLEGDTKYSCGQHSSYTFQGPLWRYTEMVINDAVQANLTVLEACEKWGSWAGLFDVVPSILYILMKHSHDPEEAIVRAVTDTRDNDTYGSIVGAAIGALHGLKGIPDRWIGGLTGRTRAGIDDSGEIFKLLLLAKKAFWLQ